MLIGKTKSAAFVEINEVFRPEGKACLVNIRGCSASGQNRMESVQIREVDVIRVARQRELKEPFSVGDKDHKRLPSGPG